MIRDDVRGDTNRQSRAGILPERVRPGQSYVRAVWLTRCFVGACRDRMCVCGCASPDCCRGGR